MIFYGVDSNLINITETVYQKCCFQNVIYIPASDTDRAKLFGDPIFGVIKNVYYYHEKGIEIIDNTKEFFIDLDDSKKIYIGRPVPSHIESIYPCPYNKLAKIHSNIKFLYGKMEDEYPEQLMSARFLKGDERVLEIGGNIGRNSMVIASLLKDSKNLVVMETDANSACKLYENRDLNGFHFSIENSALSLRPLYQYKWQTILYDEYEALNEEEKPKWYPVNTISYTELKMKYQIEFDTLVLDCEGAFYWILRDMPEILDGIRLIIMENDYNDIEQKNEIDEILEIKGFNRIYVESGGWGVCYDFFFEAYART